MAVDKRARALSAGARTKHNYGMSAQRPQSARPAFSSAEYEEAKRRVRRLDATVAGAQERPSAGTRRRCAPTARGRQRAVLRERRARSLCLCRRARREADFVANLRRNIAELRECIVAAARESRRPYLCFGRPILSFLCSQDHYAFIFVLPVIHIGAPGSIMLSYLFSRESSLCDSRARHRPG